MYAINLFLNQLKVSRIICTSLCFDVYIERLVDSVQFLVMCVRETESHSDVTLSRCRSHSLAKGNWAILSKAYLGAPEYPLRVVYSVPVQLEPDRTSLPLLVLEISFPVDGCGQPESNLIGVRLSHHGKAAQLLFYVSGISVGP